MLVSGGHPPLATINEYNPTNLGNLPYVRLISHGVAYYSTATHTESTFVTFVNIQWEHRVKIAKKHSTSWMRQYNKAGQ